MDIDPRRLEECATVVNKLIAALGIKATAEAYSDQLGALAGANFVSSRCSSAATCPAR